jgi:DNA-binding MarR family transcriptional regulator
MSQEKKMNPGELNHLYAQTSHMHFRRTIFRFSDQGLGEGQPKVLFQLRENDGCIQAELARHCHLEPATVTATLCRMEKAALVKRLPDAQDMRVTRVFLTEAGREMGRTLDRLNQEIGEECFAAFTDGEREQMRGFLARMADNMHRAETIGKDGEPL